MIVFEATATTLERKTQIIDCTEIPTDKKLGECLRSGCNCKGFKPKPFEIAVCKLCGHICEWHKGVKAKEIPE